jgi:hypothetical protein
MGGQHQKKINILGDDFLDDPKLLSIKTQQNYKENQKNEDYRQSQRQKNQLPEWVGLLHTYSIKGKDIYHCRHQTEKPFVLADGLSILSSLRLSK